MKYMYKYIKYHQLTNTTPATLKNRSMEKVTLRSTSPSSSEASVPISVTNFPFRVASRRYSYGGTADDRPVICNTDNEVPEEQE